MSTLTLTLKQVFAEEDLVFEIPKYQRPYSWDKKQLNDLWNDLYYLPESKSHFLSLIITVRKSHGLYEVVDGQQRLTTISILISVLSRAYIIIHGGRESFESFDEFYRELRNISNKTGNDTVEKAFKNYIFDEKNVKIKLLFSQKTFEDVLLGKNLEYEGRKPFEQRLIYAKNYFEEKVRELPESEIIRIIKNVNRARVIYYQLYRGGEAPVIFNTINDRGKPLINLEKTKSLLISMLLRIERENNAIRKIDNIHRIFETIYDEYQKISSELLVSDEDTVQRAHFTFWHSKEPWSKRLKKIIRELDRSPKKQYRIKTARDKYYEIIRIDSENLTRSTSEEDHKKFVMTYINNYLESLKDGFRALSVFISRMDKVRYKVNIDGIEIESYPVKALVKVFPVVNLLPLIMAMEYAWIHSRPPESEISEFYKLLEIYMVRALGRSRVRGITTLWKLSREIYNGSKKPKDAIEEIKELLNEKFSDADFEDKLGDYNMYRHYVVAKYILANFEVYLRKRSGADVLIDPVDLVTRRCPYSGKPFYEIEHIVHQRMVRTDWRYKDYIHRFGNLTLCMYEWNEKYFGDKDFRKKKDGFEVSKNGERIVVGYGKSDLYVQKELIKYDRFGIEDIQKRTQDLISFAKKRWSLPQLKNIKI